MSGSTGEPCARPISLRERVRAGEAVIGCFVKTASHQTLEILGLSGLDFVVIDAEHAPFDRSTLDHMIPGAAVSGLPALVRVPSHDPAFINGCLDMGAAGLLVPHVLGADDARAVVASVKYGVGQRGFSPSGRAGGYGSKNGAAYRAEADAGSNIWCQIEDAEALDHLDEIAEVDAVDCLFIGPADLSLSLQAASPTDPRVKQAIRAVAAAGLRHHRTVGMFIGKTSQIPELRALGISLFVCGSDQSLLLGGARQLVKDLDVPRQAAPG